MDKSIKFFLQFTICLILFSLSANFLFSKDKEFTSITSVFMASLVRDGVFNNLMFFGFFQIVCLSFLSVLKAKEQYKLSDLEQYRLCYNGPSKSYSYEEKQRLVAELNYIIDSLKSKIQSDTANAWHWEIKLKSATYTLNRLIDGQEILPLDLSEEDKRTLDKESSLLTLNDYSLNAKSDASTVHSIKEKMALYRKHRQEQA